MRRRPNVLTGLETSVGSVRRTFSVVFSVASSAVGAAEAWVACLLRSSSKALRFASTLAASASSSVISFLLFVVGDVRAGDTGVSLVAARRDGRDDGRDEGGRASSSRVTTNLPSPSPFLSLSSSSSMSASIASKAASALMAPSSPSLASSSDAESSDSSDSSESSEPDSRESSSETMPDMSSECFLDFFFLSAALARPSFFMCVLTWPTVKPPPSCSWMVS